MQPGPQSAPFGHVAIVGGGFSGTILAVNLARLGAVRATLIERRPKAGRGVAYSAALDDHLLNVRACNMSAFPDDPGHFERWLEERGLGGPEDFVPRLTYGAYLEALLADALARCDGRVTVVRANVESAMFNDAKVVAGLAGQPPVEADALVLAIGNLPPHEPSGLAALGPDFYAADPWAGDIAEGLTGADQVLIVGTGLTMIDVALLLESRGFGGRIVALSRRGLLPRGHVAAATHPAPIMTPSAQTLSRLVQSVRARASEIGWREAIDAMRPHTQQLWQRAGEAERRCFVRHLRPYWDVHRHRIAPRIAARIEAMRARGQLVVAAGRIETASRSADQAEIVWRPRGSDTSETLRARRIVNCTGPQTDLLRTGEMLLRSLATDGHIRPDALRLGIDVNDRAETIDTQGAAQPNLLAIGPMTRAATWEIVAVPDIRVQAWSVARRLSGLAD